MSEDNDTDEQSRSDSDIELRDVIEFGAGQAKAEVKASGNEVPNHAPQLLVARAVDVMQTATNIDLVQANQDAEDEDALSDDHVRDAIEEATIDVLLAIGTLDYEYDLRLADAFERRKQFIEDFNAYEDAMEDVDTQEEAIEAFEEHMSEHADGHPAMMGEPPTGVEIGENVDNDDYDHDGTDRSYA